MVVSGGIIKDHMNTMEPEFYHYQGRTMECHFLYRNASVDPGLRAPGNGPWFTFTTIIPETPTPTRKTTEVHYHYNTSVIRL